MLVLVLCWMWSTLVQYAGHEDRLADLMGCSGEDSVLCRQSIMVALRAGPLGYAHVLVAGVAAARVFIVAAMRDGATGNPVGPETKRAVLAADSAPFVFRFGCCIGYLAYVLLVLFAGDTTKDYYYFYHNGGLMPVMLLVLVGAAVGKDPLTVWLFRSKPLLVLGRLSYAQYLTQHIVWYWMVNSFGWDDTSGAKTLFLPSLVIFAYFAQRYIERPYTEYQRLRQEKGIKGWDDRCIERLDGLFDALRHCRKRAFHSQEC